MIDTENMSTDEMRMLLRDIIEKRSLERGEFTLASGASSNYYFNLKETIFYPPAAQLIADLILDSISHQNLDFAGGLEMGAVPIAAYVGLRSAQLGTPISPFFVRKSPKDHGTKRLIDIDLSKGSRVVVLEDVTTSGGSAFQAVEAVRREGCEVDTVVTLLDRQEGAEKLLNSIGIRLISILRASDFDLGN